jgi:hypothetical protein
MSFYATISGYLRYRSKEALDKALTYLRENRWMNEHNVLLNESDEPITPQSTLVGMTLYLPRWTYRNLAGRLDLLAEGADHRIAWSSTDGMNAAGVLIDGKETEYDLEEWAAEHQGPPDEGEDHLHYLNEAEWDFIEWAEWKFDFRSLAPPG